MFSKIPRFSKTRLFQNYVFFKSTSFSKLRLFQNYVFFKITCFSISRVFQNLAIFKITKRGGVDPLPSLIINMFFWLNKILRWLKMASETVQNIRNGWAPEIKRLNDNLEKLEASLTGTDECVLDIYSLEETLQDKIHLLEGELATIKTDIADLKGHLTSVIKELDVVTGGGIEDELFGVKAENIEMRNHFNSMIKQLNKVTAFVNQKHGYRIIEETAEFDHGTTPYGFDEIDRGTTPPSNSPRDKGYNLRSHVIDVE